MSRALDRSGKWIGWAFFADLADALALTFGYMFSKIRDHAVSGQGEMAALFALPRAPLPEARRRGRDQVRGLRTLRGSVPAIASKSSPTRTSNRRPAKFEIGHRLLPVLRIMRGRPPGGCDRARPAVRVLELFPSRDLVIGRDDLLGKPGKAATGGGVVAAHQHRARRAGRVERAAGLRLVAEYPAKVNEKKKSGRRPERADWSLGSAATSAEVLEPRSECGKLERRVRPFNLHRTRVFAPPHQAVETASRGSRNEYEAPRKTPVHLELRRQFALGGDRTITCSPSESPSCAASCALISA